MIAELFKEGRYQRGLQRGIEQGMKEGHERGRQEGIREGIRQSAALQEAWAGWNRRREQAHAEGREFNEPPPTFDIPHNGQ